MRSTVWMLGYAADDALDPLTNCSGYPGARNGMVVSGDCLKVASGPRRIDDVHAPRNLANAALTSASLATSPRSSSAMASSMACNSSAVAQYTPARRASMSRAYSANSSWSSSGQDCTCSSSFCVFGVITVAATKPNYTVEMLVGAAGFEPATPS